MENIANDILKKVQSKCSFLADVYAVEKKTISVQVKDQKVDSFDIAHAKGVSLRVLGKNRTGFSYITQFEPDDISNLIEKAIDHAQYGQEDTYHRFIGKSDRYPAIKNFDFSLKDVSVENRINNAMILEKSALDYDQRVTRVRHASYNDSEQSTILLNSIGLDISYNRTICSTSIMLMASDGKHSETGWEFDSNCFYDQLKFASVGKEAARKGVEMLGAKKIKTGRYPIILDPNVAVDFLGIFSSGLSADSVQKGKSPLSEKINNEVTSSVVNIYDDGTLDSSCFSFPADDEGTPSQKTELVNNGILKNFLFNSYTAQKGGTVSTGNGIRPGIEGIPSVGITNLFIKPGKLSEEELIGSVTKGIYITSAMGVHTANPISGEFSIGIAGHFIENGKRSFPVRGITLSGNIYELMKNVQDVANNLRFFGKTGSPSLFIKELTISGK